MNDAGYTSGEGLLHKVFLEDFGNLLQLGALVGPMGPTKEDEVNKWLQHGDVAAFRRSAIINTFTLVGEGISIGSGSDPNLTLGPDLDQVRTLPNPSARRKGVVGQVREVLPWPQKKEARSFR
jgi:hypothetical protein